MKNDYYKIMQFLRLIDDENKINLSSLLIWTFLFKPSFEAIAALTIILISSAYDKYLQAKSKKVLADTEIKSAAEIEQLKADIDKIKSVTTALSIQSGFKN